MVGVEVAHAYGAQFPGLVSVLKGTIRAIAVAEWLMEEHKVDIVRLELAEALVDRRFGLFVAIVGNPDLGDEENVGARNAALADGVADTLLVVVRLGRVHHPIADPKGVGNASLALSRRHLEDAISYLRHHDAVVQFHRVHIEYIRHYGITIFVDAEDALITE